MKYTTELVKNKCKEIFKDAYDYSYVEYNHKTIPIKVICPLHGFFEILFFNHIYLKRGCQECSKIRKLEKSKYTLEDFIRVSNEKHDYKYDYSYVKYENHKSIVEIICPIHDKFEQRISSHIRGRGCQKCARENSIKVLEKNENSFSKSGFKSLAKDKICTFYLIKCWNENEEFYKIGITTKSVNKRYNNTQKMPYNFLILKEIKGDAEYIWNLENNLKIKLIEKYKPLLRFPGSVRECYLGCDLIYKELEHY